MDSSDDLMATYRAAHAKQPTTDTGDLTAAIKEFEEKLPGWWWSVCVCSLTRDADCGPDAAGPDYLLCNVAPFSEGFQCAEDGDATLASSLRDVMNQALKAKAEYTGCSQTAKAADLNPATCPDHKPTLTIPEIDPHSPTLGKP